MQLDFYDWSVNFNTKKDIEDFFKAIRYRGKTKVIDHYFVPIYPDYIQEHKDAQKADFDNNQGYHHLIDSYRIWKLLDVIISRSNPESEQISKIALAAVEDDILQGLADSWHGENFEEFIKDFEVNFGITALEAKSAEVMRITEMEPMRAKQEAASPFRLSFKNLRDLKISEFTPIGKHRFTDYNTQWSYSPQSIVKILVDAMEDPITLTKTKYIPKSAESFFNDKLHRRNLDIKIEFVRSMMPSLKELADKKYRESTGGIDAESLAPFIRSLSGDFHYVKSHSASDKRMSNFNKHMTDDLKWLPLHFISNYLRASEEKQYFQLRRGAVFLRPNPFQGFETGAGEGGIALGCKRAFSALSDLSDFFHTEDFETFCEEELGVKMIYKHKSKNAHNIFLDRVTEVAKYLNYEITEAASNITTLIQPDGVIFGSRWEMSQILDGDDLEEFDDRMSMDFDHIEISKKLLDMLPVVVNFEEKTIQSSDRFKR